jgi:hypothetical protein
MLPNAQEMADWVGGVEARALVRDGSYRCEENAVGLNRALNEHLHICLG